VKRIETWLLVATVFLAPWASVGVVEALAGRSAGFGIQPAVLPLAAIVVLSIVAGLGKPSLRAGETAVVVALLWTGAAAALTWSIRDMGLAGDAPWIKSTKQLVQWSFLAGAALAVARIVERGVDRSVDRALALGLVVSCSVSVVVAILGADRSSLGVLDTNPSIASGSDELYLGHSFTGISRLRAPMPEPLMFGSYLLAVVPVVALAGFARTGFARWWRWGAALFGAACLMGTWSRGAWLGGLTVVLGIGFLWARGRFGSVSRTPVFAATGAAALAGVIAFSVVLQVPPWELPSLLAQRVGQSLAGHDMSNMTRIWAWKAAIDLFREAPFAGQGWGSYGFLFFRHASDAASGAHFGWPVPNNLALLLLAESGLLGLVLWVATLWPALRALRDSAGPLASVVVACASLGVLVHLATFSQWNLPHLWVLYGAGLGMARWSGLPPASE
jgi:O-antigen ligase